MAGVTQTTKTYQHTAAVIGGAVAGAAVAAYLAERGILTVVFEQNARPFGKIEDGLPRWHTNLRRKEFDAIAQQLSHEHIHLIPKTTVGEAVTFDELHRSWGFDAIVLACGAWRDRPLKLDGIEPFVGDTLLYQNPFIYWYNHHDEEDYAGPRYTIRDGGLVVGGGLASVDVAKALNFTVVRQALRDRGTDVEDEFLDKKGISAALEAHNLSLTDIGFKGASIVYRRRIADMPLTPLASDADQAQREKAGQARQRLVDKLGEKYGVRVLELHQPQELLIQDGKLNGLLCKHMKPDPDKPGGILPTDITIPVQGPLIVSSIGSIPKPIPGLPMRGELFDFADGELGRFADFPHVFSVGNVVTGRGNIKASRHHAEDAAETILADIQGQPPRTTEAIAALHDRIRTRQKTIGFSNLPNWLKDHPAEAE